MTNSFWGACLRTGTSALPDAEQTTWHHALATHELCLQVNGDAWEVRSFGSCVLLVRGQLVLGEGRVAIHPATYVESYYRRHQALPCADLEGSFTLALLDGQAGRVLLYRNLVGNSFTYYTPTAAGFWFGSNLPELLDAAQLSPTPNNEALPSFFLFRAVPGRETLFAGIQRLLPGELVTYDTAGLQRRQVQTFADLYCDRRIGPDAVERIEAVTRAILTPWAEAKPETANLLSGGVDSSYLQAIWNCVLPAEQQPQSYSVSVNHPRTQPDTEYALSAARAFGSRHTLVPADEPYGGYLLETLAATGEPPNHVMTAYFGTLAQAMTARGLSAGLCGEGADSLFGLPSADPLRIAQAVQRWLPLPLLRQGAARLLKAAGRNFLGSAVQLAEVSHDPTAPAHPLNQAAVFTDWAAVSACFGDASVSAALAQRRELLEQFQVGADPLDRLHAIGYLGEAVDTASLWTTLFNTAGGDLCCPYLDSRMLRLALNFNPAYRYRFRRPKDLLKQALARHAPPQVIQRPKLGFGQPIFEWLSPGGQLRSWVERLSSYPFVDRSALAVALARPTWFLYSLLCYDLWHQLFINRTLPRRSFVASPPQTTRTLLRSVVNR